MAKLGCADEYEAVIVDSFTQVPMKYLPWGSIRWQRRRNEISQASVDVPCGSGGIECCREIGGLEGWDQMLRIERNGEMVWDGPVTGWRTDPQGNLTIRAQDRFCFTYKRLVGAYRFLENRTPPAIIAQLLDDSDMANPNTTPYAWDYVLGSPGTERATREYLVERMERVYDCINEIIGSTTTGFYTTLLETTYLSEADIRYSLGDPLANAAPILSERTTIGRPAVDVDALNQATYTYVGVAGQGTNGFPIIVSNAVFFGRFLGSLLERGSAETRAVTQADATLIAARDAARYAGPDLNLEQIVLSPDFGSPTMAADLSNLLPGVVMSLRYDETCAFNVPIATYSESGGISTYNIEDAVEYVRLDLLDVSVSKAEEGIQETVSASCRSTIAT